MDNISHNLATIEKQGILQSGFSTLEMLIAMTILTLALSAATLTTFGGEMLIVDGKMTSIALGKAEKLLGYTQTLARKDFTLAVPMFIDETMDGTLLHEEISVETLPDNMTKMITSTVSWAGSNGRTRQVFLSALATNFDHAVGGDTCNSVLSGNWMAPHVGNPVTDLAQLAGDPAGIYPTTDVDAYRGKLYVTVTNSSSNTKETFFIFDISTDPSTPTLTSKIDNASGIAAGLSAVRVDGHYAYVATAYGAPYTTCLESAKCAQLQVIDIRMSAPQVIANLKIPGVSGVAGQAIGQSIYYDNGYVYLGLAKTASGPEFNIIDVHDPHAPHWVGGYAFGAAVNAIRVVGNHAYVATPNTRQLSILDVSDPAHPALVGGFTAPGGNGKALVVRGDTLYLGKTTGANELDVLDNTNPAAILPLLGSRDVGSESINGLIVRDHVAFDITKNGKFQTWNVADPAAITLWAPTVALAGSGGDAAFDCEGNYFFAVSVSASKKGALSVITSSP